MGEVTVMDSKNNNVDGGNSPPNNGNTSAMKEAAVRNPSDNSKIIPPVNGPSYLPPQPERYSEAVMNMTLFDPPRWGWTAVGGIADLLSPHEVSFFFKMDFWSSFFDFISFGACKLIVVFVFG
jgi:hypothetical protein